MTLGIGIADVGAGYTTVLVRGGRNTILDFGSPGYHAALDGFYRMLDRRHRQPLFIPGWERHFPFADALVISHPHRDHFSGLLAYAGSRKRKGLPPLLKGRRGEPLKFYHPRIPDNPEALGLVQRLIAIENVLSGIPEYQLGLAVMTCTDGAAERIPLQIGSALQLAGQPFDVMWPPAELSPGLSLRLGRLVEAYDALADEAARQNDSRLIEALDRVRQMDELNRDDDAASLYHLPEGADEEDFTDLSMAGREANKEEIDDPLAKKLNSLRRINHERRELPISRNRD